MWTGICVVTVLLAAVAEARQQFLTSSSEGGEAAIFLEQMTTRGSLVPFLGAALLSALVVLGIAGILLLWWKASAQHEELHRMERRVRGLNHSVMMEEVKLCKDKEKIKALRKVLAKEEQLIQEEEGKLTMEEAELSKQRREIDKDRRTIAKQQTEIATLTEATKNLIQEVHERGRVHVDITKQMFSIKEPIPFEPVTVTPGMDQFSVPPAKFQKPKKAKAVLEDLALLLNYVPKAVVLVEGHTAGGAQAVSDVGFAIASERAERVVEVLLRAGVSIHRLESKGRPGTLGDNQYDTKLVTLSWGL